MQINGWNWRTSWLSEIIQVQKTKGQIFSMVSGERYIMGVGGGWEKNGGILDYVEGNGGGMKNGGMRQTSFPTYMYDYTNGENLHCAQPWKQNDVPHLCTINQNVVCKK